MVTLIMQTVSSCLSYVLSALSWGAFFFGMAIYIGRRSKTFLYIALYALTCLLLEVTVLAMERQTAISHILTYVLSNANVIRG